MAQFYGSIQGARGEATRLGDKESGLSTTAASWEGCVRVYLDHVERQDGARDEAYVSLDTWYGAGRSLVLYTGPVGRFEPSGGVCKDLVDELTALVEAARASMPRNLDNPNEIMPYDAMQSANDRRLYDCAGTAELLLRRLANQDRS